jgi:hypothetical protein
MTSFSWRGTSNNILKADVEQTVRYTPQPPFANGAKLRVEV